METLSQFKNFLVDKDVYFANRRFWNDTINKVSAEPHEQWVITQFANGVDFLDGNPIASVLYKQWNKAIRIIQVVDDNSAFPIRIWLDSLDYQETKILELVVLVQPRDEVYHRVIEVLSFFLFQSDLKKIARYVKAFNSFNRRVASLQKSVELMLSISPVATTELMESAIKIIYERGVKRRRKPERRPI